MAAHSLASRYSFRGKLKCAILFVPSVLIAGMIALVSACMLVKHCLFVCYTVLSHLHKLHWFLEQGIL